MNTPILQDLGISKFLVKLKDRREIAEGTMAFHFEKPAGFEHKAGQFVDMTVVNPPDTDEEGNVRAFSIASAPYEQDLIFATRLRGSAFKRWLKTMPLGTEVKIAGPFGNFVLHKAERPAIFLAGGIGITPFRSIILQAAHDNDLRKLFLFYSNRTLEDAPFLEEMQNVKNPDFNFVATMTELEKSKIKWEGEQGYINKEMIGKYVGDLSGPVYYIAGPSVMVSAMHKMLAEAGVSEDDIKVEQFSGY